MSEAPRPFLPKTVQMSEVDVRRAQATRKVESPKRSVKGLMRAAVIGLAGFVLHPPVEPSQGDPSVVVTNHVDKVPVDIGLDRLPELTVDAQAEKGSMTAPGRRGVEARARNRRVNLWRAYLKPVDREAVDQVADHESSTDRDRVIYRADRVEQIETTITEKMGEAFLGRMTELVEQEARSVVLAAELPKTQEEAGLLIDTTIERALRLAYVDAQREGWKGTNLVLADTLAMGVFSRTIRDFVHTHLEFADRDYSVLFRELRGRSDDKRIMESEIPDLRRAHTDLETGVIIPQALPETEGVFLQIIEDEFDLLGEKGERAQLEQLQMDPYAVRLLLGTPHLSWFEDHERQIRDMPNLREATIQQISRLLDRGDGLVDRQRQRLFDLRVRLLPG